MERKLFIIRHAKSSWSNPMQGDFERTLNERGEQDAPMMGKRLKALNIKPDIIIASTAKRASQTARRIAKELNYNKEEIIFVDKLYHCAPKIFVEVINDIDAENKTAIIIAHNPGITDFANQLSDTFRIDNMPTCGIVGVRWEAENWQDFMNQNKEVFLFEYPKKPYDKQ